MLFSALRDLFVATWLLAWLGSAVRVAVDAGHRYVSPSCRRFWTAMALVFPLVGAALYLVARPAETRAERRLRRRRQLYLELADSRQTAA